MTELRLRYCALLLALIRREVWRPLTNWPRLWDLCDRFERAIRQVYVEPLLWEGDYA